MHYYTFKPKDYMSKTAFLEPMEDLAYRRMLDHCYLTEQPLPESVDEIAMLIRMRTHSDSIKVVLHYFFELTPQGYVNDRIAREILSYHGKSSKAKASADARWAKEKNKIKDLPSDANAMRTHKVDDAEAMLTSNHKPITNNHNIQDKPVKFVFKKSLIEFGADEKLVDDWLVVRKTKKASNTETALNGFIGKVKSADLDVNTALKLCVERSWTGFDKSWLANVDLSEYQDKKVQDAEPEQPRREIKMIRKNYLGK